MADQTIRSKASKMDRVTIVESGDQKWDIYLRKYRSNPDTRGRYWCTLTADIDKSRTRKGNQGHPEGYRITLESRKWPVKKPFAVGFIEVWNKAFPLERAIQEAIDRVSETHQWLGDRARRKRIERENSDRQPDSQSR